MSKPELLKRVVEILQGLKIDYMLTGSLASSLQGEPRATFDIDFLLSFHQEMIPFFIDAFSKEGFYLDRSEVEEALQEKDRFALIEKEEGERIDFWILTESPFDLSRLSRHYQEELMGIKIWVSSAEDTILGKLRWASLLGGSEKHFIDALRVYEVQKPALDLPYLERWAELLDLKEDYQNLLEEARVL